uniref:hypothetical protein n=1 Tax=Granulicella cerasi TaxID=741063 RepID=UPI0036F35584
MDRNICRVRRGRVPPDGGPVTYESSPNLPGGAWSIEGRDANGGYNVAPIGGFYGALSANGTTVRGSFDIASSDLTNPYGTAACLNNVPGNLGGALVDMTGTSSNGTLTLDGDFASSHVHIVGTLSADRQSITNGSFVVTGKCATTSPGLWGQWNAPLTGTYAGSFIDANGATHEVSAQIAQANYYIHGGFIPLSGTLTFKVAGCQSTGPLDGELAGYLSTIQGIFSSDYIHQALLLADDSQDGKIIDDIDWSYSSSSCGTFSGSPPAQLVKQ